MIVYDFSTGSELPEGSLPENPTFNRLRRIHQLAEAVNFISYGISQLDEFPNDAASFRTRLHRLMRRFQVECEKLAAERSKGEERLNRKGEEE